MYAKDLDPSHLINELQTCTEDIVILRKLINFASSCKQSLNEENLKQWQPVLTYITDIFVPYTDTGRERILLASHAFFTLLSMQRSLDALKSILDNFLRCRSKELRFLDKEYYIADLELFKLICVHGYLQVNQKEIYSNNICILIFEVIHAHCIKYTQHSYFAYKVLSMWLSRTMKTSFWSTCDSDIEQKLEAMIFSNWCNAINEISKQNSVCIFKMYLQIMEKKYPTYLEYLFTHCVDTISWQNELKYDILAQICEVCNNVKLMTTHDFLLSLCTSLTKYNLRSAGTKVYIAIIKKLSEDEWKETFGCIVNYLFHRWETTEKCANHNALQLLCTHWLEPIVKKYRNVLPYLWNLTRDINGHFLRSYLQRMASEMHIDLPQEGDIVCYINHKHEIVRLNGFAINCYQVNKFYNEDRDQFSMIRHFLWYNVNSTSVYVRDGIVKYFKIFYANILKMCDTKSDCIGDVHYVTDWLHQFLLDCFEIGSCYQRKILGLNLYRAIQSFTNTNAFSKSKNIENTTCTLLLEKHLQATGKWKFTDKNSLFALLRLVLDSALDVKQSATSIILDHFDKDSLTNSEKKVLYHIAMRNCNSSKFYEVESGAALLSILTNWLPLDVLQDTIALYDKNQQKNVNCCKTYSDFLLNEAESQLMQIKEDILKAIVQNKPFYGVLTALLTIAFQNGPESSHLSLEFIKRTLRVLKDATDFFLYVFSSKSKNREYSSSFAEMGLAIDEAIKSSEVDNINFDELSLTPAHQVLVSCTWMSLKVSCEIACKIGALMHSEETVQDSVNIIATVLRRCRHKGAVESAGSAIGNLTRTLCKEAKYCDLPKMHIVKILEDDMMHSLNITRRGAGLSIMFHRIVVGDIRRDRPLLHLAVQTLLNLLQDSSNASEVVESQYDSPCARRLHFLRTLVADKEIHAQLIPYMERISLTCFQYLESEIWTIRNASLQLFGAIVPRLVGQSYGDTLDFGTGYSINHFVTHYPVLANNVMKQLQNFSSKFTSFSDALYLHSSIVHILILLSKFSSSGCNLIDYSSRKFMSEAKYFLRTLFKNPVLYIRLLAAKAYAGLTEFSSIESEIQKLKQEVSSSRNINLIHGCLSTMKYLREKLSFENENMNSSYVSQCTDNSVEKCVELLRFRKVLEIWNGVPQEKNSPQICYMLETLFLQLSDCMSDQMTATDVAFFNQNTSVLSSETVKPGFYQFLELSTKLYAEYVKRTNNVNIDIVEKILDSHYLDQSTSFLNRLSDCIPVLKIVLERLLLSEHDFNELLLNAMINYVLRTLKRSSVSHVDKLYIKKLVENLTVKANDITYSNLNSLKCILIILFSNNETIMNKILSVVRDLSVHEEEHMRQTAVEFMRFSVRRFAELTDENKLIILHCCLILLKDEIAEIREAIAECLRERVLETISSECTTLEHDERIYQKLLSEVMVNRSKSLINKDAKLDLIKLFTHSIKNFDINATIENPFYHDDNPFYREESKFLNICFYYIQLIKYNSDEGCTENSIVDVLRMIETRYVLQEKCFYDYTNLEAVLNTKYVDYLLRKQRIVIQEYN